MKNAQHTSTTFSVASHARRSVVLGGLFWLAGCAARLEPRANGAQGEADSPLRKVTFQDKSISPRNGGQMVESDTLRDGDILLTSSPTPLSLAIRAFTLAPVSHAAIFIGNDTVIEAVGSGIRRQSTTEVIDDSQVVVAFRHPKLEAMHAEQIRAFALSQVGRPYNHVGVVLHVPFSLQRRVCELPIMPELVRDACIRGVGAIQLGAASNDRFFCSQFVLEAYRRAGLPMTRADPRLVSAADLLHMREGDVPSLRSDQTLEYVGHLKYAREV